MWQPGETINFSASAHVEAIHAHAGRKLIDCVVLNSAPIPPALTRKYARAQVKPVENDVENLTALGVKVVTADLVSDLTVERRKIRHDSAAIARVVIDLASRSRVHQVRKEGLAGRRLRSK
jgi:2-phospho-L-lactate transferase/gluconeogenesis factor (CofD/UPF0052 family)